mmetsp:Transcript_32771/g.104468  ORF Transcript_32771/g.104468 Transcript_32771/m.104468 type:complete len:312 (+) Transcript_32771:482-1417(+)
MGLYVRFRRGVDVFVPSRPGFDGDFGDFLDGLRLGALCGDGPRGHSGTGAVALVPRPRRSRGHRETPGLDQQPLLERQLLRLRVGLGRGSRPAAMGQGHEAQRRPLLPRDPPADARGDGRHRPRLFEILRGQLRRRGENPGRRLARAVDRRRRFFFKHRPLRVGNVVGRLSNHGHGRTGPPPRDPLLYASHDENAHGRHPSVRPRRPRPPFPDLRIHHRHGKSLVRRLHAARARRLRHPRTEGPRPLAPLREDSRPPLRPGIDPPLPRRPHPAAPRLAPRRCPLPLRRRRLLRPRPTPLAPRLAPLSRPRP